MYAILMLGTAGSGKSTLTARLVEWYASKGAYAITLNLDPGVIDLPYEPDVDVRSYVSIDEIMSRYRLGPNGALILASDLIADRLDEIQREVDELNPDYVIVDTPGQLELFAYRASGVIFAKEFRCDAKASVFLFDPMLANSPSNMLSISLLATSIRLRLGVAQVNVLSKIDLIKKDRLVELIECSADPARLEYALQREEKDSELYLLGVYILRGLKRQGMSMGLLAVSSITYEGMVNLAGALARMLKEGEDVEQ
ncbi:MAG: ATP/GTP-binding protein [Candidatus Nitrosocaldus sp.]